MLIQKMSKAGFRDRKPQKTGKKQENRMNPKKTGKTGKTVSVQTLYYT